MKSELKISLWAILISISIAGCKKSNDQPFQSYIRMAINGTAVACNANIKATAPLLGSADGYITISGDWATGSVKLEINEGSQITPGDYLFEAGKFRQATVRVSGQGYLAGAVLFGPVIGSGKIKILEISNDYVKGSFEFITGIFPLGGISQTVTNGEFHIKRSF